MKKYIVYTPSNNSIGQQADLLHINKYLSDGKAIKIYKGAKSLNLAIGYADRMEGILIVSRVFHLGDCPKKVMSLCERLGYANVMSCDMPYLNEWSIPFAFAYNERLTERQGAQISASMQQLKSEGHKLGNPQNLTPEAQRMGSEANKQKAMNDPANVMAYPAIKRLRELGETYEKIATHLNEQGMRTTKGKLWRSSTVQRLYERGRKVII